MTAPAATVIGATIGSATTTDGIPLEEGIIGGLGGLGFSQSISGNFIPGLTGQKRRDDLQSGIEKKVKARLKNDEKARIKARDAFEEANDKARDKEPVSLKIKIATANLYLTATNQLSASVHVIAENAEYVAVTEKSSIPSAGWEAYQENINYVFEDNDVNNYHNLYIYVKDSSGNVENKTILNLKF